ncbi:hypothetical protein BC830DRAFT_1168561 [Chytriomyces sp. MP71]|nr:hypothetical protein BC830DRAFT_1168561 [Chytriomyces sp. MP71]
MRTPSHSSIPSEIQLQVCSHLPLPELGRLSQASRAHNQLINASNSLWKLKCSELWRDKQYHEAGRLHWATPLDCSDLAEAERDGIVEDRDIRGFAGVEADEKAGPNQLWEAYARKRRNMFQAEEGDDGPAWDVMDLEPDDYDENWVTDENLEYDGWSGESWNGEEEPVDEYIDYNPNYEQLVETAVEEYLDYNPTYEQLVEAAVEDFHQGLMYYDGHDDQVSLPDLEGSDGSDSDFVPGGMEEVARAFYSNPSPEKELPTCRWLLSFRNQLSISYCKWKWSLIASIVDSYRTAILPNELVHFTWEFHASWVRDVSKTCIHQVKKSDGSKRLIWHTDLWHDVLRLRYVTPDAVQVEEYPVQKIRRNRADWGWMMSNGFVLHKTLDGAGSREVVDGGDGDSTAPDHKEPPRRLSVRHPVCVFGQNDLDGEVWDSDSDSDGGLEWIVEELE